MLAVYIFKFIFFHKASSEPNEGKPVAGVVLVFILAALGILLGTSIGLASGVIQKMNKKMEKENKK